MFKTTLATLVLVCCAAGLTTSATALAPCDGVKQCKIAQCQAAKAAKVAQVTSDRQAQCAAAKAARVAQIKSGNASVCCTAAKAAQVAQVTSDKQAQCAAVRAARVAQIKSGNASACCTAGKAAQAAQVAQVKSRGAFACCGACNGAKAAQAKYVAFGCTKTDAAVRKAAYAYLKAVAQMQEKIGAKGCALEAASKTLAAVVSEEMAKYQGAVAAKSDAPVVTSVSLGSVSGCGPDCTKACCTN